MLEDSNNLTRKVHRLAQEQVRKSRIGPRPEVYGGLARGMRSIAERLNQLGGTPNFNPEGLAMRAASQYTVGGNLIEMIKENLVAERIACEHYRELIRFFGDKDPTTSHRQGVRSGCIAKRTNSPNRVGV
jgi:Mn-containing catalase